MYYFASDTHFGMDGVTSSKEREKLFVRWLDEVSRDAKAIFLVGDIFDFWFEWKRVVPKGFTRLLGKLSELTDKGIEIHFFKGNHDMWAYSYLFDECGVKLHDRPEIFELYGKNVFIAHGDNLYVRKPFLEKVMHGAFHSKFLRKMFASLVHPNVAMRFGIWWSEKSRKSRGNIYKFRGEDEYLIQYARQYQECLNTKMMDYFVFGHIHCAEDYDMRDGSRAIFLGEWLHEPAYAVFHPDGKAELKKYR